MLVAGDHSVYIGVITNVTFALILALVGVAARPGARWARLVFWGMNLGLLVFVDRARGRASRRSRWSARRSWACACCRDWRCSRSALLGERGRARAGRSPSPPGLSNRLAGRRAYGRSADA